MQSDTLYPYGRRKSDTRTGGVGLRKQPKDLSVSEREGCENGEGRDVYPTLFQSDTVQSYGRSIPGTRPGGVELRTKPKDLSASEREECGHGEGGGVYATVLRFFKELLFIMNR